LEISSAKSVVVQLFKEFPSLLWKLEYHYEGDNWANFGSQGLQETMPFQFQEFVPIAVLSSICIVMFGMKIAAAFNVCIHEPFS
jgi:hypothetical protein